MFVGAEVAKKRRSPLFAMLALSMVVGVWATKAIVERETPSVFEVLFSATAVWMFYERSDEALDIAIRFFDKDDN